LNCKAMVDLVDSSSSATYGQDGNGHGTHVAGEAGLRTPEVATCLQAEQKLLCLLLLSAVLSPSSCTC
jgi:subtilisin family serine protease